MCKKRISNFAQLIAAAIIVAAGLAGGLIGYSLVDLQCQGACLAPRYTGGIIGAAISAVGVGIVGVLVLRAMHDWQRLGDKQ